MKVLTLIIVLFSGVVYAQTDTLSISLPEAQRQFSDKNLLLMAQKYNIEAQKAQIIQAKLFANPTLNVEQGLILRKAQVNDQTWGPLAQHAFGVQQLILLAGKRNKNIQMAQINTEMSEYAFYDLMRTLTYTLNQNFYELAFQIRTLNVYQQEILTISKLVTAYKELNKDGNAPLKDVARLESFQFSLQTSKNNIELAIAQNQADLRTLLGISSNVYILPQLTDTMLENLNINNLSLPNLLETARLNRSDLKLQEASVRLASTNLLLQKAMKVPDLTLGYAYDRGGSYTTNYSAATAQINLPFFNKNQGNIKTAAWQVDANKKYYEQLQLDIDNQVYATFNQVLKTEQLYRTFDKSFVPTFTKLIDGVMEGYRKNTISMVEFMDFFDSYKQNIEQLNNFQNNRIQAYNQLSFVVGKAIY